MSKHSEPYEDVKVRFYGCKYGYIKFDLTVGSQAVTVRMTDCWDPVPDLFRWMEAILTNVMECSFFIDEEQTDKGFVAKRMGQERVLLIVNDREDKIFIESVVHRKQMVEAFYKALKDYAGSDEYVPEEWQELTLEFLLEKHIDLDLDTTLDYIIQMSRVEVEEFFFKLAPEFIVKWPVIKDESKHWKKSLTYFLEPDNKEHKLGMKKKPLTWDLDENFDSWDFEKRREYILEYIQSLLIDSYQGSDLRKVKSEKIENYIGWNSNIIQFKPTL